MIYFCADLHFGHFNIIKYSSRPYANANEMDETLIANWNAVVAPNDTVYNLGDFSFSKYPRIKEILARLNGSIVFIMGNHDHEIDKNWEDILYQGKIISMQGCLEVKLGGKLIVMNHYAHRVWNASHRSSWHLYGHSHGTLPPHGLSVDVGVDCKEITLEYRPVSLDEVAAYMSKRKAETVDHHLAKE
jgi:calcineurin-like phosphoesterase family protein